MVLIGPLGVKKEQYARAGGPFPLCIGTACPCGCMVERIAAGITRTPACEPPAALVIRRRGCGRFFRFELEVPMAKEAGVEVEGLVTEVLPDRMYRVRLENGHEVLAYGAGKMSKYKIRVLQGDRVTLSLSPYDLTRGRITYRHK